MKRAFLAAFAALLVTAGSAGAVAVLHPPKPATPVFDGRVLVQLSPNEASALRVSSLRGMARMRTASAVVRNLTGSYELKAASVAVEEQNLFPEARTYGLDRWFTFEFDAAAGYEAIAARLRAMPGVEYVEPALTYYQVTVTPNDTTYARNWGHNNTGTFKQMSTVTFTHIGSNVGTVGFDTNIQSGWGAPAGYGPPSMIIGIIDSGIDPTHPDLSQVPGHDYVYDDVIPSDSLGHGTGCAGIAAGIANNTKGVAGAAGGVSVMALRGFTGASGSIPFTNISNCITYGTAHGAKVLSMSFSFGWAKIINDAFNAADAAGVVLVASTGNENNSAVAFPANHPKVIAIGAASPCGGRKRSSSIGSEAALGNALPDSLGVSCDNEVYWGSNWGVAAKDDSAAVDFVAPTMLPTTDIQGSLGYSATEYSEYFNGTSCAAPYAAGVIALLRAQHPTWTPAQVRARLVETAIDLSDAQTPAGWDKYTGYGMINAGLPDLVPFAFGGWSSPIVPRAAADASFGSVPAPTLLNGDVNSYLNLGIANLGDARSGNDLTGIYVDDVEAGGGVGYNLSPGTGAFLNNLAWVVRGGRHVVGLKVNKNNDIDEINETNNRVAHQWSWVPATMPTSASTVVSRLTPPNRNAGRADVPVSETTYDNVDAMRMVGPELFSTGEFWLMSLHPSDDVTDVDLGLYFPTSSATANFTPGNLYVQSTQSAGKTEWAIVNLATNPFDQMDTASLLVAGTGQSRFESRLSGGSATTYNGTNTTIGGSLGADQMVAIQELSVLAGGVGGLALELNAAAGVHFAVYDPTFDLALRSTASRLSTVFGLVQGTTWTAVQGRHAIVIYRDRTEGTAPLNYTITVRRPTGDLTASTAGGAINAPAGVYKDGVGNSTSPPAVLDGNVNNTRFYYGYTNTGTVAASGFTARELLDGGEVLTWTPGAINAGASTSWISTLRNIRGGRHTMGFANDFGQSIDEFNEIDNDYAVQKVWSPLTLTMGVPVTRGTPPDPTGGWAQVPAAVTKYNNVDGLRLPTIMDDGVNGYWWFVAATPRTVTEDVDLAVYPLPISSGPGNGFTVAQKTSTFPAGRTELLGFDAYAYRPVDLGLVKAGAATGSVVVHGVKSISLGTDTGTFGPYTLDPDKLLAVFELHFINSPNRQVRLINLSGNANLDLRMFDHQIEDSIYVPLLPNQGAVAEANGDGGDEVIQYNSYLGNFPAVVVTKRGSADISKAVTFQLQIGNSTIGTEGETLPAVVSLAPVRPNPMQASGAVLFDLPRAGVVRLSAYDVAGRHVATLASGDWAAGRHTLNWAPKNEAGARLANGVYLLKLEADGVEAVQRVVVMR